MQIVRLKLNIAERIHLFFNKGLTLLIHYRAQFVSQPAKRVEGQGGGA